MGRFAHAFGPHAPDATYVPHAFPEQLFDTGEVQLNHVVVGSDDKPALLLIPGQSESWWGYEEALPLLAAHFQAFAVDLRGQGRSTRTPGRYTLDNMGNDLVRFIDGVIRRPTFVSGLSSGGVLSAWLSAYAPPGQVIGAVYEDPPLFASEVTPACGQSIRHGIGPMFALWSKYLGDQWSIGDWDAMVAAAPTELPAWIAAFASALGDGPPQNLKEYDPEWGRAFWGGTVAASCDHARMLAAVKTPVLLTHHFHQVDEAAGTLMGALSDLHAERARLLITEAGQPFELRSFPTMGHSMHGQDPALFTATVAEWTDAIPRIVRERVTVVVTASRSSEVGSLTVRRALPNRGRRTVGAWCFADHMGPVTVTEERGVDIGPHPHTGLQTVTWLVAGEILHRDSLGSEQPIRPGQLNLMTAGHGVSHSEERTGRYRGDLHGIQLWIAQPEATRHGDPGFEHHAELPRFEVETGTATVLVGELGGTASIARHDTPLVGADLALRPGRSTLPLHHEWEHALVVLAGALTINGTRVQPGHLGYLGAGIDELTLDADGASTALLIGGAPLGEPIVMWWNFVARTHDEIVAARTQWMDDDGRFGTVASTLPRIPVGPPPWAV